MEGIVSTDGTDAIYCQHEFFCSEKNSQFKVRVELKKFFTPPSAPGGLDMLNLQTCVISD